jgi:glycine cleavage system H protein
VSNCHFIAEHPNSTIFKRNNPVQPQELLYAKTHEWVHVDQDKSGQKIATIGISHFAVEALTDLVYIELPAVGRHIDAGESFGEVESVKAVSDLYSPVGGEIVDVNGSLQSRLDQLHDDPYGAGWIVKIKIEDDSALSELLDFKKYQQQCAEEGH